MDNKQSIYVIACGALAREIQAIVALNDLNHVTFTCLPAQLHNDPDKIPEAVRQAIHKARADGHNTILIGYADCGTGGRLDKVCEEEGVTRVGGPHCYAFFSGTQSFLDAGDHDMTSFFLTDFLARHFRTFVIEPLGLDRHPELRDMYFGNYERVVYLEQAPDPAIEDAARNGADFLGLAFEKRATGYGDFASFLSAGKPVCTVNKAASGIPAPTWPKQVANPACVRRA